MTLYDVITDLCNAKTGNLPDDPKWDDVGASAFMLQRWMSMTNTRNAVMTSLLTNHVISELDPVMAYRLYTTLASKSTRRFTYLKKAKHVPPKASTSRQYPPELSERDKVDYDKLMLALEAAAVVVDAPK